MTHNLKVLNLMFRFFKFYSNISKRNMNIFVQKLNPITGADNWVVENEEYDYHQEVARAAFADMLHDYERNQLYEQALKKAIDNFHQSGKKAKVLDIGTGTGLLSMMAARHGADTIHACEAFKPMSECALKIIKLNGYENQIKVIPKRSTELTVGETGDLPEKCNILVTEVFDTELIGEGALSTFDHAHKVLLEKDCIVVPHSATIYAQVVECPLAQNWNKPKDIFDDDGDILIKVPESVKNCSGAAAVHDIQLSQLPRESFNTIVAPTPVLRFDWSGKTPFIFERSTITSTKSERDGKAQMVFMWWDLQMDTENQIILSCAPYWAHPAAKSKCDIKIPWRDHWMQAVYYLPQEVNVKQGQEVHLISCHDEYSLWFNLSSTLRITDVHHLCPVCECGLHVAFSRTRLGQINDVKRNKKYLSILEKHIEPDSTILFLGEGFYFGLVASKLGAQKVYFFETKSCNLVVLKEYIKFNNLTNVEIIEDKEHFTKLPLEQIDIVFGEPYFSTSILPWDNLLFSYLLRTLERYLKKDVKVFPGQAVIKAVVVCFDDLHKIRSPLGKCEGFLMKDFDDLIQESSNLSDDNVEAQPLWEYPCIALCEETEIASINTTIPLDGILEKRGVFEFEEDSVKCNGIALWVEWKHDDSPRGSISTGPISPITVGKKIHWDMHTRQGVYLFPTRQVNSLNYKFQFDFKEGHISFHCE